MTDKSLLEDFADETREHLEELESSLLHLESDSENPELLNTIFRSMHTIKGASEYLGFERIARLSHRLENLLDLFRDGSLDADKIAVDLLIDARDRIGELVSQVEVSGEESAEIEDLLERAQAMSTGTVPGAHPPHVETVYEGEADAELFDIFVEQLIQGVGHLVELANRLSADALIGDISAEMVDQVERLAMTANYMGYDALSAEYNAMMSALSQMETLGSEEIDTVVRSTIRDGIDRIKAFFPHAPAIAAIDLHTLTMNAESNDPASDLSPESMAADDVLTPSSDPDDLELADELELSLDGELPLATDTEDPIPVAPAFTETDHSLLEDFVDETREHLEDLESNLLRLESDPGDRELLNTIFRSMHTIKGASEYLGFEGIAGLSHRLENLLDLLREGSLTADQISVDLLIDASDRIGELVSQVEASGHESADIDDLLERAAAIISGSLPSADPQPTETVYEGEADTELFDIFMEQLISGLGHLMNISQRLIGGGSIDDVSAELVGQVEQLATTANYMGYDALSAEYDALMSAVNAFSQSTPSETEEIDTFVQTAIVDGIGHIKALFPHHPDLAALDTTTAFGRVADTASTSVEIAGDPPPEEIFEPAVEQPADDIADLLAGLPTIDDDERESLLSKSLDDTFSAMHSDDAAAVDGEPSDLNRDPIAMQFSSSTEATDTPPLDLPVSDEADEALAIIDDFGTDDGDGSETLWNEGVEDEEADLWPEAPIRIAADPDDGIAEPDPLTAVPKIDFSTPPPSGMPTADQPDEPEAFAARSTIRKSIRVDADKVDDLMDQVGELVVNRSSFMQLFHDMRELTQYLTHRFPMEKADQRLVAGLTARLNDATTVLGRVSNELQEQVMKVRMLPISRLFNRYPRLVHDLLKDADKKIQLQLRGEETELDRMVIEQLADPMIHIIRNAVDHGIETQAERRRKGKPESGVLLLEAFHEGSNVIIEITDDGNGIDLSRIRQKAIEKQLADRESLERMDQQALVDMIMLPGFSTTDRITHTSGRGVGMDVVKRNIEKINGSLVIDTRQDVGTRIRIKIPLTLAIIPALMIRCGGSHFTVPLSAVQETLRIDRGELFSVDGTEVMHLHEEPLPVVRLSELLNMPARVSNATSERLFVVVVKSATGRTGFVVDALLGRQEVVIKPLEDYLQENSGFSGATILGDGGISLILDVDELVVMAKERETERKLAAAVL